MHLVTATPDESQIKSPASRCYHRATVIEGKTAPNRGRKTKVAMRMSFRLIRTSFSEPIETVMKLLPLEDTLFIGEFRQIVITSPVVNHSFEAWDLNHGPGCD